MELLRVRIVELFFGCYFGELGCLMFCVLLGLVVELCREVVVLGGFGFGILNGWE